MIQELNFEKIAKGCKWLIKGKRNKCMIQVHYNQHVSDKLYSECSEQSCGIFHFVSVLRRATIKQLNDLDKRVSYLNGRFIKNHKMEDDVPL